MFSIIGLTFGVVPQIQRLNVQCDRNGMKVMVEFDNQFNGIIFSKGHFSDPNCRYVNPSGGRNVYEFFVSSSTCGTMSNELIATTKGGGNGNGGKVPEGFKNVIIIQNDPDYQEVWDSARRLSCDWVQRLEKTITFSPFVDCWMDIQRGHGPFAPTIGGVVPIGEKLTVVIYVRDSDKSFDVHVKDCYAYDQPDYRNPNAHAIKLTDEQGCPLKEKLVQGFFRTRDVRNSGATIIAYGIINAFKFPEKMDVFLACNVEVCKGGCMENVCQPVVEIAGQDSVAAAAAAAADANAGTELTTTTSSTDDDDETSSTEAPAADEDEGGDKDEEDKTEEDKPSDDDEESSTTSSDDTDKADADEEEIGGDSENGKDTDEDSGGSSGDDEEASTSDSSSDDNGDDDKSEDSGSSSESESNGTDEESTSSTTSTDDDEEDTTTGGGGDDDEEKKEETTSDGGDVDEEAEEEKSEDSNGNGGSSNEDEESNGEETKAADDTDAEESTDNDEEEKTEDNNDEEETSTTDSNGSSSSDVVAGKKGGSTGTDEQTKEGDEAEITNGDNDEDEESEEERKKRRISTSLKLKAKKSTKVLKQAKKGKKLAKSVTSAAVVASKPVVAKKPKAKASASKLVRKSIQKKTSQPLRKQPAKKILKRKSSNTTTTNGKKPARLIRKPARKSKSSSRLVRKAKTTSQKVGKVSRPILNKRKKSVRRPSSAKLIRPMRHIQRSSSESEFLYPSSPTAIPIELQRLSAAMQQNPNAGIVNDGRHIRTRRSIQLNDTNLMNVTFAPMMHSVQIISPIEDFDEKELNAWEKMMQLEGSVESVDDYSNDSDDDRIPSFTIATTSVTSNKRLLSLNSGHHHHSYCFSRIHLITASIMLSSITVILSMILYMIGSYIYQRQQHQQQFLKQQNSVTKEKISYFSYA
ncbi:hypothetical protein DERP_014876 [Dermatophagoides pteronyssinus]|uniref:ZP domain-containing protein n=1 Tax=Dermatophagoides pteronyssinus TaxID=6956 RepID=A0ABQ8J4T4_DERPT|nr:hypothetical protein DERP_014876 [Dermatophagoides pteronyssinus]